MWANVASYDGFNNQRLFANSTTKSAMLNESLMESIHTNWPVGRETWTLSTMSPTHVSNSVDQVYDYIPSEQLNNRRWPLKYQAIDGTEYTVQGVGKVDLIIADIDDASRLLRLTLTDVWIADSPSSQLALHSLLRAGQVVFLQNGKAQFDGFTIARPHNGTFQIRAHRTNPFMPGIAPVSRSVRLESTSSVTSTSDRSSSLSSSSSGIYGTSSGNGFPRSFPVEESPLSSSSSQFSLWSPTLPSSYSSSSGGAFPTKGGLTNSLQLSSSQFTNDVSSSSENSPIANWSHKSFLPQRSSFPSRNSFSSSSASSTPAPELNAFARPLDLLADHSNSISAYKSANQNAAGAIGEKPAGFAPRSASFTNTTTQSGSSSSTFVKTTTTESPAGNMSTGSRITPQEAHNRLCHLDPGSIGEFCGNSEPALVCPDCEAARQEVAAARIGDPSLSEVALKSNNPLELIHASLCGPLKRGLSGAKYFVVVVDDFSRFTFVLPVNSPAEVGHRLVDFLEQVEREFRGLKVRGLKITQECRNRRIIDFARDSDVLHLQTVPNKPLMKGVAERVKRSLMEAATAMRRHAGAPVCFWDEAIVAAAYIRNRCVNRATGEVPLTRIIGTLDIRATPLLPIDQLPTFGSDVEVGSGKTGIFVGYSWRAKKYRVLVPKSQIYELDDINATNDSFEAIKAYDSAFHQFMMSDRTQPLTERLSIRDLF
ncbi:hypothetical protein TRVA0_020S01420 [Trichomonascus vanleenenianus]|uniref:uncharacterized protein n=1 Tax=Trichomonascus vanleenenianus TaxID=2268995 RepID=UPI003EC9D4E7